MHTRAALLLIEFQNEWLHPEGKLRPLIQGDLLQDAAGHAQEALAAARAAGMPVVHAGLRFSEGHPELGVARHGLRAGIRKLGTFPAAGLGSGIPAPFAPASGEFVVQGRVGASAFSGSNLDAYLRNQGIGHLYLAGFALQVCVAATAWAAHDLGYEVTVLEDAVAAFDRLQQARTLEDLVHHVGDRVTVAGFRSVIRGGAEP